MIILFTLILFALLSILSYVDIKTYCLPNVLTFLLVLLGVLQAWVLHGNIAHNFIGIVAGYAVFLVVEVGFKATTGKNGLGRGDAKLFAGAGAWLGWAGLPVVALVASVSGIVAILGVQLVLKKQLQKIPFGPFLAIAIAVVWVHRYFM